MLLYIVIIIVIINVVIVLLARLFTGMFTGIHMSLMRVYIFETSDKLIQLLPRAKRQKSTIKYTAIFILLIHGVIGRALAPGNNIVQ